MFDNIPIDGDWQIQFSDNILYDISGILHYYKIELYAGCLEGVTTEECVPVDGEYVKDG